MLPITLDHASGVPIYVQLKDAIYMAVRTGSFRQGTQLPTVRQLAVELRINANTVSRAYMELEREGVISSQQGRGTFVTLSKEIDFQKLAAMNQMIDELLIQAGEIDFSVDDVMAILETKRRAQRQSEK
ncbi:MAG: GntR family transcriptional regulator [Negativicutes bacterium]